jgi:hypothetical protein
MKKPEESKNIFFWFFQLFFKEFIKKYIQKGSE